MFEKALGYQGFGFDFLSHVADEFLIRRAIEKREGPTVFFVALLVELRTLRGSFRMLRKSHGMIPKLFRSEQLDRQNRH